MKNLNDILSDEEKIKYIIKELYEKSTQPKEKEKFSKILIKLEKSSTDNTKKV